MTGPDLLSELKKPGAVFIWLPNVDAYVEILKADLRNTLSALADLDTLDDIRAYREGDDRVLLIDDFGPADTEFD